jgi:hypothetical protein
MNTISTDEWRAELDTLILEAGPVIVPEGGFTVADVMARYSLGISAAKRRVDQLIKNGQVVMLGVRPGTGREMVFDLVKDNS